MAKKTKQKKQQDDYWASEDAARDAELVEESFTSAPSSGFAALSMDASTDAQPDEEDPEAEVEVDGLMAQMAAAQSTTASKKKGKKGKKNDAFDFDMEAELARLDTEAAEPQAASSNDTKKKNNKKGKGGKKNVVDDFDGDMEAALAAADAAAAAEAETAAAVADTTAEAASNEGGKSKKGKGKGKKAGGGGGGGEIDLQAMAAAMAGKSSSGTTTTTTTTTTPAAGGGKKKKGGDSGSTPAHLVALRQRIEAQRKAEEEEQKRLEEEKRREEEERLKQEAEEKKKEEERQKKKLKQKERIARLKKEGKPLTKEQKEAERLKQLRLQQLLEASNVRIPALSSSSAAADDADGAAAAESKPKRVVYDNRRKRGGKQQQQQQQQQTQTQTQQATTSTPPASKGDGKKKPATAASAAAAEEEDDEVKSEWDASDDDEKKTAETKEEEEEEEDVKSEWDASSSDEDGDDESSKAAATASAAEVSKPAKSASTSAPAKPTKADADNNDSGDSEDEESEDDGSDDDEESDDEDDSDDDSDDSDYDSDDSGPRESARARAEREKLELARQRRLERIEAAKANRSAENLRSPIACILGHVDTGKTKLLDKIRQTNVQGGEAGGITQQIGATYFPIEAVREKTAVLFEKGHDAGYRLPGLLIIDTPGHESFTNLRSRGSSLCNIAILVVDIMHGLEPQTIESINLLRQRKAPFVVALNKIDRLFGWNPTPNGGFRQSFEKQSESVKREFNDRLEKTKLAFAEQGLNTELFFDNKNVSKNVSLIPTSAITGEGIPDLLDLLVNLTQGRLTGDLMYLSEVQCTVLEVKVIEGFGTTIDVVLSNGVLREGDRIVLCGLQGAIVTNIRALLTPQPMRELRVKSEYVHHQTVKAALGVKISAPGLEHAIAGSRLLVVEEGDDENELKEEVLSDLKNLSDYLNKSGPGVYVQASTLGSLEALLEFLKQSKIPVNQIALGTVFKKDVTRAATMLEKSREHAVLLCFDVKVEKEAQDYADDIGVRIFKADIIYHLFDQFTQYYAEMAEQRRKDAAPQAIFPAELRIIPGAVFNTRSPIIIGVDVAEGQLRIGTPLCVIHTDPATKKKEILKIGYVGGIEHNKKSIDVAKKGKITGGVAVKIDCPGYMAPRMFGRHFTEKDPIYSHITRTSIDVLKEHFRKDVSKEEWALVVKLKGLLDIQ